MLSTRGRSSCYLRPQFVLPSAAVRATFGRDSRYSRPKVDDLSYFFGKPTKADCL